MSSASPAHKSTPALPVVSFDAMLGALGRTLRRGALGAALGVVAAVGLAWLWSGPMGDAVAGRVIGSIVGRVIALTAFVRAAHGLASPPLRERAEHAWAAAIRIYGLDLVGGLALLVAILPATGLALLAAPRPVVGVAAFAGLAAAAYAHAVHLFPRYAAFVDEWAPPRRRLRAHALVLIGADTAPLAVAVLAGSKGIFLESLRQAAVLRPYAADAAWLASGVLWCAFAATAHALLTRLEPLDPDLPETGP